MTGDLALYDIEEGAPISEHGSDFSSKNGIIEPLKPKQEEDDFHENAKDDSHGHGHSANPTFMSLVASAVVCFVIYFVFCIVFSSVVWDPLNSSLDPNINPPFGVAQGVGINLMGIAVGSVFFAWKSGCKAIIAGPDLLPVVFFAEAGTSVATYLSAISMEALRVDCADGVADGQRLLSGGGGFAANPCSLLQQGNQAHRHLVGEQLYLDETSISKVVPTTLVAMMIGNLVTALVFYGLGKAKNTASVIGSIPASVVAGFLTCIGYKVIKLAYLITTGFSFKHRYIQNLGLNYYHSNDPWLPLLLALIYGLALYAFKRLHIVSTEKLILSFIMGPLVLFFITVAASGVSMDFLRETDWFLTQARDGEGCIQDCAFVFTNFWQTFEVAYGGIFSGLVAWGAVPRCIPIFVMGAVMTSLDNMLKLTSSEKALGIDLNYNHEMKLGGKATLVSSFLAGSPAYGQTKFNVINLSIAGTAESPLPTLFLGGICLLVFLSGGAGNIINIMPRFLLGGLCVFAGVGFLWENLWEGRKKMNRASFAIVWIIFLVNFIWEFFVLQHLPREIQPMVPGLLVVFILGIVLSTFEFMFAFMHKAKDPSIRGGDVCCSSAVRSDKHDNQLAVMAGWFQVFKVDSFVFFGTANTLYQQLKAHLEHQKKTKPKAERTKYLIFDLTEVTGIDSSARDVFFKVHRLLKNEGINLVWAITDVKVVKQFDDQGLYVGATHYDSLDLALRHVEDDLLRRALKLSEKWLFNETVRDIFQRQVLVNVFNISVRAEEKNFSSSRLRPWSKIIKLSSGDELCSDDDDNLYLLYSGEIHLRERDGSHFDCFVGSFFNLDHVLASVGALSGLPATVGAVATEDSTVLAVSRENFLLMQKQDASLALKLVITLLAQKEANRPGRTRARVPYRTSTDISSEPIRGLAKRLLAGEDYKISLTDAQIARFSEVFELIAEPGESEIPMEQFSEYVSMEAHVLGSALTHDEFMELIDASGIDEDGDGSLSKEEFLSFLRSLFLSDIPSVEVQALREAYDKAVAINPGEPMNEVRVEALFNDLGFDMKSSNMGEVIGVIDADGDGDVDFDEFLTGIGMMKKMTLLSKQLDTAFSNYMEQSNAAKKELRRRSTIEIEPVKVSSRSNRPSLSSLAKYGTRRIIMGHQEEEPRRQSLLASGIAKFKQSQQSQVHEEEEEDDEGGVELDASHLMAFLNIERDEAEEMVFLADQDEVEVERIDAVLELTGTNLNCYRSIDRMEFQQLIRTWS